MASPVAGASPATGATDPAVAGAATAGAATAAGAGVSFGASTTGAAGTGSGSFADCANNNASAVGVQRQRKSEPRVVLLVTPSVRNNAKKPHAIRMVATIDIRRAPSESPRLATAQATSARHITGMA